MNELDGVVAADTTISTIAKESVTAISNTQAVAPAGAPSASRPLSGKVICIDPGHASNTNAGTEPIGPGATETKITEPGGTTGVITGIPEYKVTLEIALRLKPILEAEGAKVIMVREGDAFYGLGRDRTLIANQAGSNLYVRIHCDGSTNQLAHGVSMLYPAFIPGWTDDIAAQSKKAAQIVQQTMVVEMGAPDLGTLEHRDMMGFNWSDVPVFLSEIGFMTNPDEDLLLASPGYQQKAAEGLAAGITNYFLTP